MTESRFGRSADAKKAGWFSRRHETDAAHRAAVAFYKQTRGKAARQRRAAERASNDRQYDGDYLDPVFEDLR